MGKAERAWLEQKYPGWNDTYGKYWDVIIDNANNGKVEHTHAVGNPALCSMCNNTIASRGGSAWDARVRQTEYQNRRYNFCSDPCQWIFDQEPDRYKDWNTVVDRLYTGEISPPTAEGLLRYMGIGVVSKGGEDAHGMQWAHEYRQLAAAE